MRGQALIIVLLFLVLCTFIAIAFLTSVTSSGVGENAAASENRASQLATTAVQIVEGTITNATVSGTYPTVAWACQPGMIRTFGTSGGPNNSYLPSSAPLAYYKLYSSGTMVVTTAMNMNPSAIFSADVPQTWDKMPSYYTDLNAPLFVVNPAISGTTEVFPIADPRAEDPDIAVSGFSYSPSMPGSTGAIDGIVTSGTIYANDTMSRLPMPVAWIYVLKDGTLTVPPPPTNGVSSGASWSNGTNPPTTTNPIVGRIAFWTDDESAKVNINTASEGTYWDTPVATSGTSSDIFTSGTAPVGDYVLARVQPAQHEYQRYPGHPATTCLSAVFGNIINAAIGSNRAQMVKYITDAIPRVSDYGSGVSGNAAPLGSANTTLGGTQPVTTGTSVIVDEDRLYASLDEFRFAPPNPSNIQANRAPQTLTSLSSGTAAQEEQNDVDTCRFFLTAHSKAPELNMFGLPRVSIWPIWDTTNALSRTTLTQFDSEILRCSTLNATGTNNDPHYFCFFRYDPTSPTNDFPTTTGTLPTVNRNPLVFNYLKSLMSTKVPGFGSAFSAKYGTTDTNQILAEIFDYIRSTNLADNSPGATPYTSGISGTGTTVNSEGLGEVAPIQIPVSTGTAMGLGRIAIIAELALVLDKVDDRNNLSLVESGSNLATTITVNGGDPAVPSGTVMHPNQQTLVEWTLIPRLASPMAGYAGMGNNIRIKFSNLKLSIGGATAQPTSVSDMWNTGLVSGNRDSVIGGTMGLNQLICSGSPAASMYPTGLVLITGTSLPGAISSMPGGISASGTISIYTPAGSASPPGAPYQTISFNFPSMQVPIPDVLMSGSTAGTSGKSNTLWAGCFRVPNSAYTGGSNATFTYPANVTGKNTTTNAERLYTNWNGGGYIGGEENGSTNAYSTDVVRSLSATGALSGTNLLAGDLRLIAISSTIPSMTYQVTPTNSGTAPGPTTFIADDLRFGTGVVATPYCGNGALSPMVNASAYPGKGKYTPEVPPQAPGSVPSMGPFPGAGDWDNGPGLMVDGPWANKPDEGMTQSDKSIEAQLAYLGDSNASMSSNAQLTTLFSPNRQVSSPVMFGSLPVGIDHPWQTLLFRPQALPGYQAGVGSSYTHDSAHANYNNYLPDHLLLDLFWMPVVEPYGISEPLATSGKINLNFQIAPFTYITRQTGLDAVLKSVMITALSPSIVYGYKGGVTFEGGSQNGGSAGNNVNSVTRYPIDATQTLSQLMTTSTSNYPVFTRTSHSAQAPNFFVSASQICDVPLMPLVSGTTFGPGAVDLSNFWTGNALTGNNSLDRPYSLIYPRVTTKSNIFTVHVIAQSLKQVPSDLANKTWTENVSQVTGEVRGAYTIEKYYDPNADDLSYYASAKSGVVAYTASSDGAIPTTGSTVGLRGARWRLLNVKRFGQ
jgi:uncharacterized protein (TIGR02600 family)